jgi:hypothetical protein
MWVALAVVSGEICWMFCLPKGDIITEVILFSVSSGNGQDEIACKSSHYRLYLENWF